MPTYDYECQKCGKQFEHFQSMKDEPLKDCPDPECGGAVKRLIGAGAGLIFKGSGFYITDYKDKKSGGAGESGSSSDGKTGGKSEAGGESKAETKSETKSEAKSESKSTDSGNKGNSGKSPESKS